MSQENAKRDLRHFLNLASAQLTHKLKTIDPSRADKKAINRMRALKELIQEQVPTHAEEKNTRPPARTAG